MVEILPVLRFSLLFWRTVGRSRAVSRTEAQVDLRNCSNEMLYGTTLPGRGRRRRRGGRGGCRGWGEGRGGRWCGYVSVAVAGGGDAWGPLAFGGLAVSIITAILSTGVSFTAIWQAASSRPLTNWDTTGWSTSYRILLWSLGTTASSLLLHRARRSPALLLLLQKRMCIILFLLFSPRRITIINSLCIYLRSPVRSASGCFCWRSALQREPGHYELYVRPAPGCSSTACQGWKVLISEQDTKCRNVTQTQQMLKFSIFSMSSVHHPLHFFNNVIIF